MDRTLTKQERQKEQKRKLLKLLPYIIGVVVAVVLLIIFFRPSIREKNIRTSAVTRGTIEVSVSASGRVAPAFEERVIAPISSRIVEVYQRAGDSVVEGTPLLRLDLQSLQTDYQKMLDELQMKQYRLEQMRIKSQSRESDARMQLQVNDLQIDKLKVEVRNEHYLDSIGAGTTDKVRETELRYNVAVLEQEQARKKLTNDNAVAASEIRVQELELAIAQKSLAEVKRTLEDAQIRAPQSGILTYISNQIGASVPQGTEVAIISDLSQFKIEGEISDSYADRLMVGAKTIVRIGREELLGSISGVTPLSKNGIIQFTVQLEDASHPRLRSGLKTDIFVMTAVQDDVLRIENGAYYNGPGTYDLFVREGDNLYKKPVVLGESNYKYVEVRSGLDEGEEVVISDMTSHRSRNKLVINSK